MGSPSRWTSRLRALSPAEIVLLGEAWLLFAWLDLSIRLRGFGSWRHWLSQPGVRRHAAGTGITAGRVIRLAEVAARHHWTAMNCLRRSLVQKRLLARRGVSTSLQIGVRLADDGSLEAHAWLTADGRPLNDSPDNVETYRVLTPAQWTTLPAFDG